MTQKNLTQKTSPKQQILFGYSFNDTWTVGAMMMGEGVSEDHEGETDHDHADHADEEDFRLFAVTIGMNLFI